MLRNTHIALVSLGLLLGTTGCDSFLTGNKLSTDPNNPAQATIQTLLVGMQGAQFAFQEGTVAMMVCMWVQQCGATNGRFVEQAGRYVYGAGSNIGANGADWALIYAAGGLIDMDTIASIARVVKDDTYLGIDLVWKAFTVGSAADLWGSIPYSEIRTSATPKLDSQLVVYDTVQGMLSRAILASPRWRRRPTWFSAAPPYSGARAGSLRRIPSRLATGCTLSRRRPRGNSRASPRRRSSTVRSSTPGWASATQPVLAISARFTLGPLIRSRTCGSRSRTTRRSGATSSRGRRW